MAKKEAKIKAQVKVQIPGGKATPAPPVGTALGPHGVNLGQFVTQFNDRTKDLNGMIVPVVITIFEDRTFKFELKSPPASVLLKQAAAIAKGASKHRSEKVGSVTKAQLAEIAKTKMADLNASSLDAAVRIIAGTARSVGLEVLD
ncbi:ribosomal protein L11 [Planctopirus limnophila DSM 3776]|jgi:large subunit ribosomal protein L11|uniref:Large ribosomal subunit protein uL11 n=2 Tax=Planctopirus TaxID=1649480 RepID=D5SPQ9_PLAL2|nr:MULTISPECIES: 50S ribosomal protein L11 [Planctopirus]ADG66289.1 ribosomal protein L11 [Planctopirus limnophila DSM 3776]QDV29328.1 50S ribosomal protein L11 [Planctopirus ephydatiae]